MSTQPTPADELWAAAGEIAVIVLMEAAARFERECPDAGGELDLCMCHAASVLRQWAEAAQP